MKSRSSKPATDEVVREPFRLIARPHADEFYEALNRKLASHQPRPKASGPGKKGTK